MEDIFKKDLSGAMVSPDEPGYDELINAIWDTMKLANELNTGYHTPDEVRGYLSRITGQEVDSSVTLLPPFYVDFGKNIRMGKRCWIQQGCTFFDRGGITLGNDVFIAPKVLSPLTTTLIRTTAVPRMGVRSLSKTKCG